MAPKGSPLTSPITKDDLALVATLRKPYGIRGGIMLSWHDPFSLASVELPEGGFAFAELDALLVPFQLSRVQEHSTGDTIVFFDGIRAPHEAEMLRDCHLWVSPEWLDDDLDSVPPVAARLQEILAGKTVENAGGMVVGRIEEVEIYPMNWVIRIETLQGLSALLPLSEALVIQWPEGPDDSLRMHIPDGLL